MCLSQHYQPPGEVPGSLYACSWDSPNPFPAVPGGGELRPWILQEVKPRGAPLFPKPRNSSPTVFRGGLCPPCFPPRLCCQAPVALHGVLDGRRVVGKRLSWALGKGAESQGADQRPRPGLVEGDELQAMTPLPRLAAGAGGQGKAALLTMTARSGAAAGLGSEPTGLL